MDKFLTLLNGFGAFISDNILWFILVYMFYMGYKMKADWVQSVRSLAAIVLTMVFAKLALMARIDPKDVMLIISLVYNFYFLVKQRMGDGQEKLPPGGTKGRGSLLY